MEPNSKYVKLIHDIEQYVPTDQRSEFDQEVAPIIDRYKATYFLSQHHELHSGCGMFSYLPIDVLVLIFVACDGRSVFNLMCVNRGLNKLFGMDLFWKEKCIQSKFIKSESYLNMYKNCNFPRVLTCSDQYFVFDFQYLICTISSSTESFKCSIDFFKYQYYTCIDLGEHEIDLIVPFKAVVKLSNFEDAEFTNYVYLYIQPKPDIVFYLFSRPQIEWKSKMDKYDVTILNCVKEWLIMYNIDFAYRKKHVDNIEKFKWNKS